MRNFFSLNLLILMLFGVSLKAQDDFYPVAFQTGEKFTFSINYGLIHAARATVEVKPTDKTFRGRYAYWISGRGYTIGAFDFFIKIRNNYDSFVDSQTLLPHLYLENIKEGSYTRKGYLKFNRQNNTITNGDSVFQVQPGIHDVISAFYYARSQPLDTTNRDSAYILPCFLGKESFKVGFEFIGTKDIKTKWGRINCMMFRPIILSLIHISEPTRPY